MRKFPGLILLSCVFIWKYSLADIYQTAAESLNELIDRADLIVTGNLSLVGYSRFYGYNDDGTDATIDQRKNEMPSIPAEMLEQMGLPLVEYEVDPSNYFKGEIGEPIILRVMIEPLSSHLTASLDRERMFLLTRNGNGNSSTYGTYSFDAILEVDSEGLYKYAALTNDSSDVILHELDYISLDDARVEVLESLITERVSLSR